ncbi:hypothetical protein GGTG_04842 [Gaeumannomyces tritici R3-111a-1]|uniref:Uncharacterized protein n=1 Tax=Gaeumannomyces tritici (strain R3-111a-1) TaxID=644352 RepID=J3NU87_GAET3|nr:hypothetical protein GGTG_04842 [Gaeumannomyces tritici R3-111a-1]EJT79758.1 hypothetical protein GGTG_04842 [Gaeumannomyces tritici R3-111a-1]
MPGLHLKLFLKAGKLLKIRLLFFFKSKFKNSVWGNVFSAFDIIKNIYFESTLFNNCGLLYIVNDKKRFNKSFLNESKNFKLYNVALIKIFYINIILKARLNAKKVWFCGKNAILRIKKITNGKVWFNLFNYPKLKLRINWVLLLINEYNGKIWNFTFPNKKELTLFTGLITNLKPDWNGIYAYGCKIYPLNVKRFYNADFKHFKINFYAKVKYLISYQTSNIYRI